ncbi:hypothetical protein [Mucilaginibacter sp.]|uniref:hypothetical protein n=1 Tax=Mucilaginibacter sp. TaxID=1882438 RepID=UPI0026388E13|nr:hypothetical protein [Mucilaginibacter sp.]MDB5031144.1 hypothetical protein [Mucilaginibacter sp.]
MKIKDDFHHLIDSIEDEQLLKSYYQLIQINHSQNGHLWNKLSEDEKGELLVAYDESLDSDNLLSHEQVKHQHKQWLKP